MAKTLFIYFLIALLFPAFFENEAWVLNRFIISIGVLFIFFKKDIKFNLKTVFPFSIILIFCIVRSFFSENIYYGMDFLTWYLTLFLLYIIFVNLNKRRLLFNVYRIGLLLAVFSIFEYFKVIEILNSILKYGIIVDIFKGVMDSKFYYINPNYFGTLLFFTGISGIIHSKRIQRFHIYNLIYFFGILFTGNRAAFLLYIIVYSINFFVSRKNRRFIFILSIIFGMVLFVYILNSNDVGSSLLHRTQFYKVALLELKHNILFGVGPGHYRYFYYKYLKEATSLGNDFYLSPSYYVHNDYLQLLLHIGIFGIVFIIYLWVICYKSYKSNYFLYSLSFLALMWIQHMIYFEQAALIFILVSSIYTKNNLKKVNKKILYSIRFLCISVFIYSLFLTVGAFGFEYEKNPEKMEFYTIFRPGYSFLYSNIGSDYNNMKEYDKAIEYFNKAISLDKYWGSIYYNTAILLNHRGKKEASFELYSKAIEYSNYEKAFEYSAEALFYAFNVQNLDWIQYFMEKTEEYAYSKKQKDLVLKIKTRMKNK